jgi:hypothetical protein
VQKNDDTAEMKGRRENLKPLTNRGTAEPGANVSDSGPELTSRDVGYVVAIEGKADVTRTSRNVC